jgi:hypothetical protein
MDAGTLGLGALFDVTPAWAPVDLDTSNGATGIRMHMGHCGAVLFVAFVGAAASGSDDVVFDVQQHTAYTSGTSADLDAAAVTGSVGVTEWYVKSETTLDGDEPWVRVTQSAASEVTLTGTTYAARQKIVAIPVGADQLGEGYTHLSVNAVVTTSAAQLGAGLYIPLHLRDKRKPANLVNWLNPGAANA